MTKKDFIIQYVLTHKTRPTDDIMLFMEENGCFEDGDNLSPVAESKESEGKYIMSESDVYLGMKVEFAMDFKPYYCSLLIPKGFVATIVHKNKNNDEVLIDVNIHTNKGVVQRRYGILYSEFTNSALLKTTDKKPSYFLKKAYKECTEEELELPYTYSQGYCLFPKI